MEPLVPDLVAKFERAWRAGERPTIEDYLPSDADAELLKRLATSEMRLRLEQGQKISCDEYRSRFPNCN